MRGRPVFWFLTLLGAVIVALTLGALPDTVATHFGGDGRANGWFSRPGYAAFLAAFGVGLPLGIVALVGMFTRRAPEWINLPHREIWLAESHRAEGLARVRAQMWWLACVLVGSAIVVHLAIVCANASDPPRLPLAVALGTIGLILGGIGVWVLAWYRRFRPPQRSYL